MQKPGLNEEMFAWMRQETDALGLTAPYRAGGIVLDEMSIQEDLTLMNKGISSHFCGQPQMIPFSDMLVQRRKGNLKA